MVGGISLSSGLLFPAIVEAAFAAPVRSSAH